MPNTIYSGGMPVQDYFEFMKNPDLNYMDKDEFNQKLEGYQESKISNLLYYQKRDEYYQQLQNEMSGSQWDDGYSYHPINNAVDNVTANRKAWNNVTRIISTEAKKPHGGQIISFDTETIGDFMGKGSIDEQKIAGITEIGINLSTFKGARLRDTNGFDGSFLIGIDEKQKEWLEVIVNKMKNGQPLSDAERSAAERMSHYGSGFASEVVHKNYFGLPGEGHSYTIIKQMGRSSMSLDTIQEGINTLYNEYLKWGDTDELREAHRQEIINSAAKYINSFNKKGLKQDTRAIAGYNLAYDINVFNQYASLHGTQGIDDITYADPMEALRAYAEGQDKTVASIVRNYNINVSNSRIGSLEALGEAIGLQSYAKEEAHNAFNDSNVTTQVLINKDLDIVNMANTVLSNHDYDEQQALVNGTIVKINKNGNIRRNDILTIDDKLVTSGFQVTNQEWELIGHTSFDDKGISITVTDQNNNKTSVPLIDSSHREALHFRTNINGHNIDLYKTFSTRHDIDDFISSSVSILNEDQSFQQTEIALRGMDLARREADSFFNPNDAKYITSGNSMVPAGGYAAFKEYYTMYSELPENVASIGAVYNKSVISTREDLIKYLDKGDNLEKVLDYYEKTGTGSATINHFRTTKAFKTVNKNGSYAVPISDVVRQHYDERFKMRYIFDTFNNNSEFFEYMNKAVGNIKPTNENKNNIILNNVKQTIASRELVRDYLHSGNISRANDDLFSILYSLEDMHNVSIRTGADEFVNIDSSNVKKATSQLYRAFKHKDMTENVASYNMAEAMRELVNNGFIRQADYDFVVNSNKLMNNSYTLAGDFAHLLSNSFKDVNSLTMEDYSTIMFNDAAGEYDAVHRYYDYKYGLNTNEQLSDTYDEYTGEFIHKVTDKTLTLRRDSSSSSIFGVQGAISDDFIEKENKRIAGIVSNTRLYSGSIFATFGLYDDEDIEVSKRANFDEHLAIDEELSEMGYSRYARKQLSNIIKNPGDDVLKQAKEGEVLGHPELRSNIYVYNQQHGLTGTPKEIVPFFFSTEGDTSDFLIFTNKKNAGKVINVLTDLQTASDDGTKITGSIIKKSLDDISSYYEISKVIKTSNPTGLPIDDIYAAVLGMNPETSLITQGDNGYLRYASPIISMYETSASNGQKVKRLSIQSGGDEFLLRLRRTAFFSDHEAYMNIAEGNFSSATRRLNNLNIKEKQDLPAPLLYNVPDGKGGVKRGFRPSQNDIIHQYSFKFEDDMMNTVMKENAVNYADNEIDKGPARAFLYRMFETFDDRYSSFKIDKSKMSDSDYVSKVISNMQEQFEIFEKENMSYKTGGMSNNEIIENSKYITDELKNKTIKVIRNNIEQVVPIKDAGLFEIIVAAQLESEQEMINENPDIEKELKVTSNYGNTSDRATFGQRLYELEKLDFNYLGTESMVHKDIAIAGVNFGSFTNDLYSGIYRPTYSQQANYRPFTIKDDFGGKEHAEILAKTLGINFGDVITPEAFATTHMTQDIRFLRNNFVLSDLSSEEGQLNKTNRGIIGAIRSITQSEININKEHDLSVALDIAKTNNMNTIAMNRLFNAMYESINLYEGKTYLRPSFANNNMFMTVDPKNITVNEIIELNDSGNAEDIAFTRRTVNSLIGKEVKSGELLGINNGKAIIYEGPTIDNFSSENAGSLLDTGSMLIAPQKQIESPKVMYGQEKATGESLFYFQSPYDKNKQLSEIKQFMSSMGFAEGEISDNLEENIQTLNRYTDIIYGTAFDAEGASHKTLGIINTNIVKHLTDMSFSNRMNVIAQAYLEDPDALSSLFTDIDMSDGMSALDRLNLKYIPEERQFSYSIPKTEMFTIMDMVEERINDPDSMYGNKEINAKIAKELSILEKNQAAVQLIQRQVMNQFEGTKMKTDVRFFQGLAMQAYDDENFTHSTGAELANNIYEEIQGNKADKSISKISWTPTNVKITDVTTGETKRIKTDLIDSTWRKEVRQRRGTLRPKTEIRALGAMKSFMTYIGEDDLKLAEFVAKHKIAYIDVDEILSNIPKSGADYSAYENFIFKVNDNLPAFLKNRYMNAYNNIQESQGSVYRDGISDTMNNIYLDVSKYNIKNPVDGTKQVKHILLPILNVNSYGDEVFTAKSTGSVVSFFNALKEYDNFTGDYKKRSKGQIVQEAFEKMVKEFQSEFNISDKDSLISKSTFKMRLPSSTGVLAHDALAPTTPFDRDLQEESKRLYNDIVESLNDENPISNLDWRKKVEDYNAIAELRLEAAKNQVADILSTSEDDTEDIVSKLHMSGNGKYDNYLRHYKNINGTYVVDKTKIENAMVVSREVFERAQLDVDKIGFQVASNYFDGKHFKLTGIDSLSRLTGEDFRISNKELENALNIALDGFSGTQHEDWAMETKNLLNDIIKNGPMKKGKKPPKLEYSYTPHPTIEFGEYEHVDKIFEKFKERVNVHMASIQVSNGNDAQSIALTEKARRDFMNRITSPFDVTGERYLSEVGIFGQTSRYPFMHQAGTVIARIYLDTSLHGNEARFLGPQFSILQNLDFDGDIEFLSFMANGGIVHKKSEAYRLIKKQFNQMIKQNPDYFAQAILDSDGKMDSFTAYRLSDTKAFKASILKDLQPEWYNEAKESFMGSLSNSEKEWFNEQQKEIQDLIVSYSRPMKAIFKRYDQTFGVSLNNANMLKAAMQAKAAKYYIGNYSKVNLDIRDTLAFLMSRIETDSDVEDKLIEIKRLLVSYDTGTGVSDYNAFGPNGILSLLEQTGIDTKHVHDAEFLNNSSAWRAGVRKLFKYAPGGVDNKYRAQNVHDAIYDMLLGSKKVLFSGVSDDYLLELAARISGTAVTWQDYMSVYHKLPDIYKAVKAGDTSRFSSLINQFVSTDIAAKFYNKNAAYDTYDNFVGELYVKAIKELSDTQFKSGDKAIYATEGFYSALKRTGQMPLNEFISKLSDENIAQMAAEARKSARDSSYTDMSTMASRLINAAKKMVNVSETPYVSINTGDGEKTTIRLKEGDILGYLDPYDAAGDRNRLYVYKGYATENKRNKSISYTLARMHFDKNGNITYDNDIKLTGIDIRTLNESIKNNPDTGVLIDNFYDSKRGILYNINNIRENAQDINLSMLRTSMMNDLNYLYDNRAKAGTDEYKSLVKSVLNAKNAYKKFDNSSYGNIFKGILNAGTEEDIANYVKNMDEVTEYIKFAFSKNLVRNANYYGYTGSTSNTDDAAKILIHTINRDIAENYNAKAKRFSGGLIAFFGGQEEANKIFVNTSFLNENTSKVQASNITQDIVSSSLSDRRKLIKDIGKKYFERASQTKDFVNLDDKLYKNIIKEYNDVLEKSTETIFKAYNRNDINSLEELAKTFNWSKLVDDDFKIRTISGKIDNIQPLIPHARIAYGQYMGTAIEDLTVQDKLKIFTELTGINTEELKNSGRKTEAVAIENTLELLKRVSNDQLSTSSNVELDFSSKEALFKTASNMFDTSTADEAFKRTQQEEAQKAVEESIKAAQQESKKTLGSDIKMEFEKITPGMKKALLVGGVTAGLLGAVGFISHVGLSQSNKDYEVDAYDSGEDSQYIASNKNDLGYADKNQAKQEHKIHKQRQRRQAPPSRKVRTIYHDPGSGFNFKVSGSTYKKLTNDSYGNIANTSGINNGNINIYKDKSKVTNNWLQNQFSNLME